MELAQINFSQLKLPQLSSKVVDVNDINLNFGTIINKLLPYIFTISGLLVFLYLVYGGYHMIIAAGDPKGLQEARGKITNAIIGFVIIFISYWLVKFIGEILGVPTWGQLF